MTIRYSVGPRAFGTYASHKPTQSKPCLPGVFWTCGGGLVGELRKFTDETG